jgi:YidC/Oxa1 family membrane protein insertase
MQTILSPLTGVLEAVLDFWHGLGFSWGWSIVMLTIIVRIILLPLTYKQFKSMRALQVLQPQIKEIQEKYKGDKQLLQQKTMEFYKENKVSPFSSCLPLLLQMPVFFALFYMLREQQDQFAGATWLWIGNIPDAPSWLIGADIASFDFLLLILYVASQFLSSLMTSTKDPTQRFLVYVMPIGVGIIMFIGKWPAGLFIYWFTSNLWTIAQQFVIMKVMPAPVPAEASAGASGGKSGGAKKVQAAKASGGKSGGAKGQGSKPSTKSGAKSGSTKPGGSKRGATTTAKSSSGKPGGPKPKPGAKKAGTGKGVSGKAGSGGQSSGGQRKAKPRPSGDTSSGDGS